MPSKATALVLKEGLPVTPAPKKRGRPRKGKNTPPKWVLKLPPDADPPYPHPDWSVLNAGDSVLMLFNYDPLEQPKTERTENKMKVFDLWYASLLGAARRRGFSITSEYQNNGRAMWFVDKSAGPVKPKTQVNGRAEPSLNGDFTQPGTSPDSNGVPALVENPVLRALAEEWEALEQQILQLQERQAWLKGITERAETIHESHFNQGG